MSRAIPRRTFLRSLGVLAGAGAAGGILAACGDDGARPTDGAAATPRGTASPSDARQAVLDALGIEGAASLNFVLPGAEHLAGEDRRLLFGIATDEREFLSGLRGELTVVRDADLEVVSGPVEVTSYEDFGTLGVYGATVSLPEPGIYRVAVETGEGIAVGVVQALDPSQSPIPQVGDAVPAVDTPTTQEPGDVERLCTRDPQCSMHDVSLAQALDDSRPVVLTIATPAYCQTAICGPVVDVIEDVKREIGRDDVAWIHVEVFSDAGNTPVELVTELELPSEPWTFFVGGDGTIVDKLEGPTPAPLVREGVEAL